VGDWHRTDPMAKRRPLDHRALAVDHLQVKLFALVDEMQTARNRPIATERTK